MHADMKMTASKGVFHNDHRTASPARNTSASNMGQQALPSIALGFGGGAACPCPLCSSCGLQTLVPEGQSPAQTPAQTGTRWTGVVEPEVGWRNGLWRAED